ncbi:DJ-1/PfpI family protein [Opitutus sp. ER46]|uniref:DJ-1/PfpI family protein n=1 Tax=Opitutus sp. ER46 TaxID=2161864 RepID=UPI000D3061DF|nr:DJ-1/PfpI family protein [Opitutus sp. ER46]PTX98502.1 AraC family transcriptional regulator [Opitutus sp. ER46]
MRRHVAILVFPEVEVLDFAGPFEVFGVADELSGHTLFHPFTIAESPSSVRARNGLQIVPTHTLESAPRPHVLIIPGGAGTRPLLKKPALLEWIRHRAETAEIVASVCTGSLVLAQAGLLKGLRATTHHENLDELAQLAPDTTVVRDQRFVDNGRILTSAGISAGIEQSLHLVSRLHSPALAEQTARYMEYSPAPLTPAK